MFSPFLNIDGSPLSDPVLGHGGTGVVVRRDGTAVKVPLKHVGHDDEDTRVNCEVIEREKDVLRRLHGCDGVVRCFSFTGDCIQMELLDNGDMSVYLKEQQNPSRSVKLSWFQQMAHTLVRIHGRRVIVADIALRNFLLSVDLSVKQCDFTESTILPLETDMETADDNGYSIYTDIGQFGAVMYEVVTGQHCEFDLFKGQPPGPARASWPRREDLPPTRDIWLGSIIERCWTKGAFHNARGLLAALEMVMPRQSSDYEKKLYEHLCSNFNGADNVTLIPRERTLEGHLSMQMQDRSSQVHWAGEAAMAVSKAHLKRVIVADVSARNLLVTENQTLEFVRVTDSRIVPEYLDVSEVDEPGLSIKHDLACFGSLLYNIVTGKKFEFPVCQFVIPSTQSRGDSVTTSGPHNSLHSVREDQISWKFSLSSWPPDDELPDTTNIFMGEIIRGCWDRHGYQSMEDVRDALSCTSASGHSDQIFSGSTKGKFATLLKKYVSIRLHRRRFALLMLAATASSVVIPLIFSRSYILRQTVNSIRWPRFTMK